MEFVVSDDHRRPEAGDPRGAAGSRLATLLRAFPAECAGPPAAQGRTTIACKSCAGSTTGASSPRCGATSPHGCQVAGKYARLCDWVEENIEETLTYYRLPLPHHKHMKSTNMLERLNQEIKRRTHVVRIFPSPASCLRLVRALAVETHEELAGKSALSEHGRSARTQEAADEGGGMNALANCASVATRGTAVKDASRAPSAVASAALRPVLTAAARGALANPRSGRRNGASIEPRNWLLMPCLADRLCSTGKRDSHDWRRG